MGSFVRSSSVSTPRPVVICPYLCTVEALLGPAPARPWPRHGDQQGGWYGWKNTHRAQICQFEFFEFIILLRLDGQFSIESNSGRQYLSQQYPPPLLGDQGLRGCSFAPFCEPFCGSSRNVWFHNICVFDASKLIYAIYVYILTPSFIFQAASLESPRWPRASGARLSSGSRCRRARPITIDR